RLEGIWAERPGVLGWLPTVDHKRIGLLYLFTTLAFFLAGGIEALLVRTQLAQPNGHLLSPGTYDELFTTHGVTMIFLAVIPMQIGAFGNYLVPLMIGARDMAFPRLNALSFWLFLGSGIFMYTGLFMGTGPNAGWFNYVPLASRGLDPGLSIDFYALGLIFNGLATSSSPPLARRTMVAFPLVALAELLVAFIGFGVWAHHMFASGLPTTTLIFFSAASMMVVIPSTIQIFAWTLTVNMGRPIFRAPLLFIGGFI